MNTGSLDRTTFETIEAYVLDRMDASQRAAFEQRLQQDPRLRAEVQLERENIHAVELGGFMRTLKTIVEEDRSGSRNMDKRSWRWVGYAAGIALVFSVAIWSMMRPNENERLFSEHFVPDPGLPVVMGATNDPAFADAMVYYKEYRFEEAFPRWLPLLRTDPANDTLLFYCGISALAMNDVPTAITHLSPVAKDGSSVFHDRSQWFLFLAYVRNGDIAQAKAVGAQVDAAHTDQVWAILNELER